MPKSLLCYVKYSKTQVRVSRIVDVGEGEVFSDGGLKKKVRRYDAGEKENVVDFTVWILQYGQYVDTDAKRNGW